MKKVDSLQGWVPLYIRPHCSQVEWGYMGGERFSDPFCHETLQRLASRPFNQMFRHTSGLDLLLQREENHPGLPLKGIVFHMSRCGSTLAAQWLAAMEDSVVLSEPEALETLLQCPPPAGNEITLRALLCAMGQPRREDDRALYLKADSMHILHIDRLLAAFPGTPWVFIYRDPVEVLVSHRRKPIWMQMLSSVAACGLAPPAECINDSDGCTAWILSLVLQQAGHAMAHHGNGLLLNYSQLPQGLKTMAAHFGIDADVLDSKTLKAVVGRNAKYRKETFRPDTEEKQATADEHLRNVAAHWLKEPYRFLERQRCLAANA